MNTPQLPRPESLFELHFPADPQLSPDGMQVAYVLGRVQDEAAPSELGAGTAHKKPRYRSQIHLASAEQGARALTSGLRDSSPRWSPDGQHLAFLSDREDSNQVYLLPLAGGEAQRLSDPQQFKQGVSNLSWSPDGRFLSFIAQEGEADTRDERGEARVITRLKYRANGGGFIAQQPAAVWRCALQSREVQRWHQPEEAVSDYVWWPDSRGLLMVSSTDEVSAALWCQEVYELPLSGETRQLTQWSAPLSDLAPHPDGQRFSAVTRQATQRNDTDAHLYLFTPHGETYSAQRLDPQDFPVGNMVAGDVRVGDFPERPSWLDERTLAFSCTQGGACGVFTLTLGAGALPRHFDPQRVVTAFTMRGEQAAWIEESAVDVPQVYLNGVQVSSCPAPSFEVQTPQRVTFDNELGQGEGWALLPGAPKLGGQAPYPALLNIHGGPHTAYGYGFMHEFQLWAARGYAACYSNPRGSLGYGQAWSSDIFGRWGSIDAQDILNFFDVCLETLPLSAERTAVMGGSYGGYMTNWLTAHTPRFQAAITDRCICNLISFGGTSDIGMRFWDDELGGNFQRPGDVENLWAMSPLKYVSDVKTPTLIIHSLEDYRCPIEQAEQWYTALRLHHVPARFVRFPGENHELSRSGRPDRRAARLSEYLNWLDTYL